MSGTKNISADPGNQPQISREGGSATKFNKGKMAQKTEKGM